MNTQLNSIPPILIYAAIGVFLLIFLPLLVGRFLTTVEAGTIRLVSWFRGATSIYKGPGKAIEVPLFTTATTIPSKAINIDLDIADQTADVDAQGRSKPIKVRVLASAIVSVGDANEMIKTAANKFFSKSEIEQTSILTDLLTSTGRRAINLLHHDELFNLRPPTNDAARVATTELAQTNPATSTLLQQTEDDDRLAIIIKSACSRELQDLGLVFNSLNIKEVQSEVAEARRRQSAIEAKANADIVTADQERRAREAQITAEQAINDKQRDLEQRRAENAAVIAQAEAKKQFALGEQREAELRATQIAKANADAEQVKVQAEAQAEADAIRLRKVADAQAEAIRKVNEAVAQGGDAYLALKQLELVPVVAPAIADALAKARLINISSDGTAATSATDQITSVIQTVLAAQLVTQAIRPEEPEESKPARPSPTPQVAKAPAPAEEPSPVPIPAKEPVAIPLKPPVKKVPPTPNFPSA